MKRGDFGRVRFIEFLLVVLVLVSLYVVAYNNNGSTIEDSAIIDCSPSGNTNLTNSVINHSTVECSNITASTLFYSNVRNAVLDNMEVNFAVVNQDTLVSGQIKYGGYSYYGPFSIEDIYAGVKPFATGSLATNATVVKQGAGLMITYIVNKVGYTVTLDASDLDSSSGSLSMIDTGASPDVLAGDGVYTAVIAVDQSGTSTETISASVNDGLGNSWNVNTTVNLDNSAPSGSMYVSDIDENKNSTITNSRSVMLHLNYSDNIGISKCRYGNSQLAVEEAELESCLKTRPWFLPAMNGIKTVYYQVYDQAGNVFNTNDSVQLNITEVPAPTVVDDGSYWGYTNRLHAYWYQTGGIDDSEATYEVRIYNSSTKDDTTNITKWIYTEDKEITVSNLNLVNGRTYYIGVVAYSGSVAGESYSDGITIDTTPPAEVTLNCDVPDSTWTSNASTTFNFSSSDAQSDIQGFSYSISSSPSLDPDDIVDVFTNPGQVVYLDLDDGIYYFKVKAKSNASLWTSIKNFTLYVDKTQPTIPQMQNPEITGAGTVYFNWTAAYDSVSGINVYNIIISNSSDFSNVVVNTTTSNLYYAHSTSVEQTYYAKVRAQNMAGLWGLFSDQYGQAFDATPPGFVFITPQDYSLFEDVFLKVSTSEDAVCRYRNSTATGKYRNFYYTGEKMHEQKLKLNHGTTYQYIISCTDAVGNENSSTITFTVDTRMRPSSLTFTSSTLAAFMRSRATAEFTLASGSAGISNADMASFKLKIGSSYQEDYAILDKGSGKYELIFSVPDLTPSTSARMQLEYGSLKSNYVTLSLNPLYLRMIANGFTDVNEETRMTYAAEDAYTIGLTTDSKAYILNSSTTELILDNNANDGFGYIFFGKANNTDFIERQKLLDRQVFGRLIKPSFGYSTGDKYKNHIILTYDGIVLYGRDTSPRGRYSFLVKNLGLTDNNKINISVRVV